MKKYLIISLLVLAVFALCWAEGFFFQNWEIKSIMESPTGLSQVILKNPDIRGSPSAVVVLIEPLTNIVLAYWYLNEIGQPYLFVLEKGRYISKDASHCVKCHQTS